MSEKESAEEPSFGREEEDGVVVLRPRGSWTIDHANDLARMCEEVELPASGKVRLDFNDIDALDTAAVAVIRRLQQQIEDAGLTLEKSRVHERRQLLFDFLEEKYEEREAGFADTAEEKPRGSSFTHKVLVPLVQARDFLAFIGLTVVSAIRLVRHPRRFPLGALLHQMQDVWMRALPVVGFLTFVIGITMVMQSQASLQKFGAEIQVISLVGDSMLRAIGFLLTALIVAGRSGSAFAAQIGAMKAGREIDAMHTSGLDPIEILVIPRILALMITFPLLGFFACILGIIGGGIAAWTFVDVPPTMFISRVQTDVHLDSLFMGLFQAPFFAALIGFVGCFQGLRAEKGTQQVGQLTTLAVVQALCLVLLAGAFFQMFYQFMDWV